MAASPSTSSNADTMTDSPASAASPAHSDSRTDPAMAPVEYVLTLDCPEAPGIVHAVSRFLVEHGSDIIDNQQFGDRRDGHFFMRVRFATALMRPWAAREADLPARSTLPVRAGAARSGLSSRPASGGTHRR